jgi:hypothetical protein
MPRFPFGGPKSTIFPRQKDAGKGNKRIDIIEEYGWSNERNGGELMSKKARRILALLNDPRHRTRLLDSLNRSTLDDVGPVGGDQEIKVLKEMNEMQDLDRGAGRKENPDG